MIVNMELAFEYIKYLFGSPAVGGMNLNEVRRELYKNPLHGG